MGNAVAEKNDPIALFKFTKFKVLALLLSALLLGGCQTAYYAALEKVGIEKRDILVDRVEDAKEAQTDAKEQFESALEQFKALTNFDGGNLEKQYNNLKDEFEDSQLRADQVTQRIDSVEQVAEDLFSEWRNELEQYSDASLKRNSERQLRDTRNRYSKLISAMRNAESKIDPILKAFNDRVLYLKHNLNARALSSLKTDQAQIESDVARLIQDMNRSISEADNFIQAMQ